MIIFSHNLQQNKIFKRIKRRKHGIFKRNARKTIWNRNNQKNNRRIHKKEKNKDPKRNLKI